MSIGILDFNLFKLIISLGYKIIFLSYKTYVMILESYRVIFLVEDRDGNGCHQSIAGKFVSNTFFFLKIKKIVNIILISRSIQMAFISQNVSYNFSKDR